MEKENLELKKLKKLAIEKLLSDEYGKYDYVEDLLGREYIMQTRPRIIRSYISELLQIPQEELNYNTFKAWLRNYKKRDAKLYPKFSTLKSQNVTENNFDDRRFFSVY